MKPHVLVAALALAACGGGEPAGSPEAVTPADIVVPAAAPPSPPRLAALPGPAVGRWTYAESRDGTTTTREDQCIFDTVTLNEAYMLFRPLNSECQPPTFRQEGSSILGGWSCGDSHTEITITGNLASAYTITEVMTSEDPATPASGTNTTVTIFERTGECSGQPPPPLVPDPPEPPAQ